MKVPVAARILTGLIAGLVGGYLAGPDNPALPALQVIGGLWLDALRMPIIPLVFSLIVIGIARRDAAGGSSRVAQQAMGLFVVCLSASALFGVALGTAMFSGGTTSGLDAVQRTGEAVPPLPPLAETLRALVPVNPIASAAAGSIVPVVIFALLFSLAMRRIDRDRAEAVVTLFQGTADALLVLIGWVLLAAPVGVFALAFGVAAHSGLAVGALLAWYVAARVIGGFVLLSAFVLLVAVAARTPVAAFVRAALPAQAVALSTQSSLAALPAMIEGTRTLGLSERQAGTVLPLAVALFRISAPTAIALATLALAHLNGITLTPGQVGLVAALAVLNNLVIAGLPNQISFFAAYAPVALAVGVPIELLPLLLAVDTIPAMVATAANVAADLAAATLLTEGRADVDLEATVRTMP